MSILSWHRERRARKALADYVKTLSPAGQARANALRAQLDSTTDARTVLAQARQTIDQRLHRVTERLQAVSERLGSHRHDESV